MSARAGFQGAGCAPPPSARPQPIAKWDSTGHKLLVPGQSLPGERTACWKSQVSRALAGEAETRGYTCSHRTPKQSESNHVVRE